MRYQHLQKDLLENLFSKMKILRQYIKPEITKILLDYSISLQMLSDGAPGDPPPLSTDRNKSSEPFSSPFDSKPFG